MSALPADHYFADNWKYLLAALVLHAAVVVLLTLNLQSSRQVVVPSQLAISAVMVDHTAARIKREKAEADRTAREKAEAEQQARDAAEEKQREKEKIALETKRAEEQRATEKKAEEKRQQQVAAEQKKKTEERDKQAATKKQAATDAKKREADIKIKQAEKLKNERDAREQSQRENELKRQLADEEGRVQAEKSGLLSQYAALIEQRVVRNWNKPASARAGIQCEVKVNQAPGGTVLSVQIDKCNGDPAVRQSIEAAVYRSSPLPPPPDARLFQRVIVFVFKPSD